MSTTCRGNQGGFLKEVAFELGLSGGVVEASTPGLGTYFSKGSAVRVHGLGFMSQTVRSDSPGGHKPPWWLSQH